MKTYEVRLVVQVPETLSATDVSRTLETAVRAEAEWQPQSMVTTQMVPRTAPASAATPVELTLLPLFDLPEHEGA